MYNLLLKYLCTDLVNLILDMVYDMEHTEKRNLIMREFRLHLQDGELLIDNPILKRTYRLLYSRFNVSEYTIFKKSILAGKKFRSMKKKNKVIMTNYYFYNGREYGWEDLEMHEFFSDKSRHCFSKKNDANDRQWQKRNHLSYEKRRKKETPSNIRRRKEKYNRNSA